MTNSRKELLKKVQEKIEETQRKPISFRFNEKTLEKFKHICEKENVTMTQVLEVYIEEFIKGNPILIRDRRSSIWETKFLTILFIIKSLIGGLLLKIFPSWA